MALRFNTTESRIALMKGEELKAFRERLELSQEQLAELLRVAGNTISRWELGRMKIPEFLDLALETVERRFAKSLEQEDINTELLINLAKNHPEDRGWINEILVRMNKPPVESPQEEVQNLNLAPESPPYSKPSKS